MLLIKKDIIILFIIIDDCTRATWVYLLQSKSDVKTILPTFFFPWFKFNLEFQ